MSTETTRRDPAWAVLKVAFSVPLIIAPIMMTRELKDAYQLAANIGLGDTRDPLEVVLLACTYVASGTVLWLIWLATR